MEKQRKINTKTATAAIIAAFALCIMVAVCGFNGTMTARALELGGSSTGKETCTLKNGSGETSEFSASYKRTEQEVIVGVNGEKETRYTWTLTVPDEILAKNNLRSENGVFELKNNKFVYTSKKLLPSPLTAENLTFLCDDEVLALPEEPTKEGYHFVGWYLDEELTVPYNGEPITADMTFYAKFEINTYTVTLDVNGGNGADKVTAEWNTAAELPTPERIGFVFTGWYMQDGTKYDGQPVTEDITLQAHWEIRYYTVTFYVDGELYKTLEVKHGMTFQAAMTADLRYYNLLNDSGEVISKSATVTEDMDVSIEAMTAEEKRAAFFAQNMWLVWGLAAVAGAGILSTAIAALVAHKRK